MDGEGSDFGPDLSHIGGKYDRPHLIESLLEPSQQIVEGYRSGIVVTLDGVARTGVVRETSDKSLTLFDANGKKHVISKAQVARQTESPDSLMPAGLAEALFPGEFADLIAYLESLRPGGKARFGSGVMPASLPRRKDQPVEPFG